MLVEISEKILLGDTLIFHWKYPWSLQFRIETLEEAQKPETSSTSAGYEETPLLVEGAEVATSNLDTEDRGGRNWVSIYFYWNVFIWIISSVCKDINNLVYHFYINNLQHIFITVAIFARTVRW